MFISYKKQNMAAKWANLGQVNLLQFKRPANKTGNT